MVEEGTSDREHSPFLEELLRPIEIEVLGSMPHL
jgi:hypothetical protein